MESSSSKSIVADLWYFLPLVATESSFTCPIVFTLLLSICWIVFIRWSVPGGFAWGALKKTSTIPGPRGWPVLGSLLEMGFLAHRRLAQLAKVHNAETLMALSLGSTRLVITSKPDVAKEILNSSAFADRPLKHSAQQLMFGRAIGFAPYGDYWRNLRRIAANHLFSPKRIAAQEYIRQQETSAMVNQIYCDSEASKGGIKIRDYLQRASLNNIMRTVFGKRYAFGSNNQEADELQAMVREGFELLGAFNWADHLPLLDAVDPHDIHSRCAKLVPRVNSLVQSIINEHRLKKQLQSESDFVDVLLSLKDEKLEDEDMIAVLWEMIFRGTDTTAILAEWVLAEIVLHPEIQHKLHLELDAVVGDSSLVCEADVCKLQYLQAVVKETLRVHPPGPLLSWARLAIHDVTIAGHSIPAGTTAMVNMWAITHDESVWDEAHKFKPERFMDMDFDIKGSDMRLAPFGGGRRVCPGRALGLATVNLWVARLVHHFDLLECEEGVDTSEVLKLSCEMASPLIVRCVKRTEHSFA